MSKLTESFEHLSEFDPEDQFLNSERSFSLISSIVSLGNAVDLKNKNKKGSKRTKNSLKQSIDALSDTSSDFSIISTAQVQRAMIGSTESEIKSVQPSKMFTSSKISFIEGDEDQAAQNIIAQKIIYYMGLFSEDMQQQIARMKSRKASESIITGETIVTEGNKID